MAVLNKILPWYLHFATTKTVNNWLNMVYKYFFLQWKSQKSWNFQDRTIKLIGRIANMARGDKFNGSQYPFDLINWPRSTTLSTPNVEMSGIHFLATWRGMLFQSSTKRQNFTFASEELQLDAWHPAGIQLASWHPPATVPEKQRLTIEICTRIPTVRNVER